MVTLLTFGWRNIFDSHYFSNLHWNKVESVTMKIKIEVLSVFCDDGNKEIPESEWENYGIVSELP